LTGGSLVQAQDTPTPIQDGASGLEVEKLKLEIERLKLENQRLELQIQSLQMGKAVETPVAKTEEKKDKKKEDKRVAADMVIKSEDLAKENESNEKTVVLDFTNGEAWYKGVRNKINDFRQFCEDQKWTVRGEFLKYDINGDSEERYRYENMYLDRYGLQSRGVFVFEISHGPNDFGFTTPEGINQDSSFGEVRNRLESKYFTLDREYKEKDMTVLRFKHSAGYLSFDDILEFRFDKEDKLQKIMWGLLDKK